MPREDHAALRVPAIGAPFLAAAEASTCGVLAMGSEAAVGGSDAT